MNKQEYLNKLKNELDLTPEEQRDVLLELESHMAEIKTDKNIEEIFGSVEEISQEINISKANSLYKVIKAKSTLYILFTLGMGSLIITLIFGIGFLLIFGIIMFATKDSTYYAGDEATNINFILGYLLEFLFIFLILSFTGTFIFSMIEGIKNEMQKKVVFLIVLGTILGWGIRSSLMKVFNTGFYIEYFIDLFKAIVILESMYLSYEAYKYLASRLKRNH